MEVAVILPRVGADIWVGTVRASAEAVEESVEPEAL